MKNKIMKKFLSGGTILSLLLAMFGFLPTQKALAAGLTAKSDVMTRLQDNTASNHTIQFTTPTGVTTTQTMTFTFPAAFDTSTIIEDDVDVKDDAVELTTAADCNATEQASVVMAADVLTVTICSDYAAGISAGSVVNIEIGTNATSSGTGVRQITNPDIASNTTYEIAIAGTMADSGQIEMQIILDDTVNITAAVDESVSFSISDIAVGFGDLTTANGRWATADAVGANAPNGTTEPTEAHNLQVATNATGGWVITYYGGLMTSGGNTLDDISTFTDSDGTPGVAEQFGISVETNGNCTIPAAYQRAATAAWDFVPNTATTIASETVPTATETISVSYLANIVALTQSGNYSTDITYIATATF